MFHARGRVVLPDCQGLAEAPARVLAALDDPEVLEQLRATGLVHVAIPEADEGLRLYAIDGSGHMRRLLDEPIRDARPARSGHVAVRLATGAVVCLTPSGERRAVVARGHSLAWSGDRLLVVERRVEAKDARPFPTAVCVYEPRSGQLTRVTHGTLDSCPVLAPDGRHIVFVSGRSGIASFWVVPAAGGEAVQLTNFGDAIDASFVPVPAGTPIWDRTSGLILFEIHYGGRGEVWALRLTPDRTRVLDVGRVAVGREASLVGGRLHLRSPSGAVVPGPRVEELRLERVDLGVRSPSSMLIASGGRRGGPGPAYSGLWSPLKVTYPLVYKAFLCPFGGGDHKGHDLQSQRFTPVYAGSDGWHRFSVDGYGDGGEGPGNVVRIAHPPTTLDTEYWHLQLGTVWRPPVGTPIGVGMPIGRCGTSGSSQAPHVHLAIRDGSNSNSNFDDGYVDPSPFYGRDLQGLAPDKFGIVSPAHPLKLTHGSCGYLSLPVPSYDAPMPFDNDPPEIGDYALRRVDDGTGPDALVHLECTITDRSGVADDATIPSFQFPNARGVHCVVGPPDGQLVPMRRIAGSRYDGRYRTVTPIAMRAGTAGHDRFTRILTVVAQDRAMEGFGLFDTGNGGNGRYLFVDSIPAPSRIDDSLGTAVPMIDLGVRIVTAPARLIPRQPVRVSLRIKNHSPFVHEAGGWGFLNLSPVRDEANPLTIRITDFRVPRLLPQEETTLELEATVPPCQTIPQQLFAAVIGPNDPDFDNSAVHAPVQVVPPNPDLIIEDLTAPSQVARGQSFRVSGQVRNVGVLPAFGPVDLGVWLSLDRVALNGNDLGVGGFQLDLGNQLLPGERRAFSFSTQPVPIEAIRGDQHVIVLADVGPPPCARICELDEANNMASVPTEVGVPDVAITSVQCSSRLVGNHGSGVYRVAWENRGPGAGGSRISVRVEGSQGTFFIASQPFQFGPHDGGTVDVVVQTPAAFGSFGQSITGLVRACHEYLDGTPADNCLTDTVRIEVPYWDLHLSFVGTPGDPVRGQSYTWRVRVENNGNIDSPVRCVRSGIMLCDGDGCWDLNRCVLNSCGSGPLQYLQVSGLRPGGSTTLTFGMCIHPDASAVRQYVKVGLNRDAGCTDSATAGNYVEAAVRVR